MEYYVWLLKPDIDMEEMAQLFEGMAKKCREAKEWDNSGRGGSR